MSMPIVIGQGEEALVEMVSASKRANRLKVYQASAYKEDGRLVFNAPRPLKPIRELPPKAYHLADFDAYERVCGRRWAMYTSSLACPYNCALLHERRPLWTQMERARRRQVVEEISRSGIAAIVFSCCGSSTTIFWWTAIGPSKLPKGWYAAESSSIGVFRLRPTL